MTSHKRTAHLLPAGIAGLGATLAIAVAMVGPAAAAQARNFGAQHVGSAAAAGMSPVAAPAQDLVLSAVALSGPVITSALQPGQTDSFVASGIGSGSIGGATSSTSAIAPTSALQPGQTDSFVASVSGSGSIGGATSVTSALWPTSALQPGQTYSSVASGNASGAIGGATSVTSALGPTSAPEPGQTGW